MKTVVLTPYRGQPGRDRNWGFVSAWIRTNYGFPVFVADSGGAVFSAALARNAAARAAGCWDVAVFHDADTIAHPDAVTAAVERAAGSGEMVVAADSHMYCDRRSSERIVWSGVPMFARPDRFDSAGVYERPCSGVFAISRDTFDRVGGFVECLRGWGYEDLVFLQTVGLFAGGHSWVEGHISLHLWHPLSERTSDTATNKAVWQRLAHFRRRRDSAGAREYLLGLGHRVP